MNKQSADYISAMVGAAVLGFIVVILIRMLVISAVIGGAVWLLVELLS